MRKDKREWADNIAQEAEHAAKHGQMKGVYDATRKLCSEPPKKLTCKEQFKQDVDTRRRGKNEVERTLHRSTEQAQPSS